MNDFENPAPSPEPPLSVSNAPADPAGQPQARRASPARWIVAGTLGVAIALFAMPFLLGPDAPDSHDSHSEAKTSAAVCSSKAGPAKLEYTLKDMNGASVRLADYKGKVILLNYWATWCGPCKVEIPDLVALQNEYRDDGLVILGISQDDDPETLRSFAGAFKMNYPVLVGRDQPEVLDAQGALWGLPTTYLIGRDGAICTRHLGPATKEEFEREIKALL